MSKLTYYETLAKLPVFLWYDMHRDEKTVDLRPLIISGPSKLTAAQVRELRNVYDRLLDEINAEPSNLVRAKARLAAQVIETIITVVTTAEEIETLDNANVILRALLVADDPRVEWLYSKDIFTTDDAKQALTFLVMEIKQYQDLKEYANQGDKKAQDIHEKTVRMESVLGFPIDVFTTSVLKFLEYERQVVKKIELQNKVYQNANRT